MTTETTTVFYACDCGCYADGSLGNDHVRNRLGGLVESYVDNADPDLIAALCDDVPPPDDAWDDREALELLNELCEDGVCWEFRDGDLVLTTIEEDSP